eukprot:3151761-Rhodomonas_salina.2
MTPELVSGSRMGRPAGSVCWMFAASHCEQRGRLLVLACKISATGCSLNSRSSTKSLSPADDLSATGIRLPEQRTWACVDVLATVIQCSYCCSCS